MNDDQAREGSLGPDCFGRRWTSNEVASQLERILA